MKLKLQSDFYKALALFSQAGCPLTQAGSVPPIPQTAQPSAVAPAVAAGSNFNLESVPSTHEIPKQQISRGSCSGSTLIASSSRPSTRSDPSYLSRCLPSSVSSLSTEVEKGPEISHRLHFPSAPTSQFSATEGSFASPNIRACKARREVQSNQSAANVTSEGLSTISSTQAAIRTSQALKRPFTAPEQRVELLSDMLPPKRKLPFQAAGPISSSERRIEAQLVSAGDMQTQDVHSQAPREVIESPQLNIVDTKIPVIEQKLVPVHEKICRTTSFTPGGSGTKQNVSPVQKKRNAMSGKATGRKSQAGASMDNKAFSSEQNTVETSGADDTGLISGRKANGSSALTPKVESDRRTRSSRLGLAIDMDSQNMLAHVHQPGPCDMKRQSGGSDVPPLLASDINDDIELNQDATEATSSATLTKPAVGFLHLQQAGPGHSQAQAEATLTSNSESAKCSKNVAAADQKRRCTTSSSSKGGLRSTALDPECKSGEPDSLASTSLHAMMCDPDFAKMPEAREWASLPQEKRRIALETWICQQLESDSFATLVKDLKSMWQRILLGSGA